MRLNFVQSITCSFTLKLLFFIELGYRFRFFIFVSLFDVRNLGLSDILDLSQAKRFSQGLFSWVSKEVCLLFWTVFAICMSINFLILNSFSIVISPRDFEAHEVSKTQRILQHSHYTKHCDFSHYSQRRRERTEYQQL